MIDLDRGFPKQNPSAGGIDSQRAVLILSGRVIYHCHPLLGMVSANAGPKGRYLADAIPNKGWQ